MKKIFYLSIAVLLIVILATCSKDVTSVRLNKDSLTLGVGETETLIATVVPEKAANKNVTWSSSNTYVASVMPNGLVTALSEGTTTIVVSTADGGFSASCAVTVGNVPVTGITLNKTKLLLNKDQSEMLIADILPQNATNKAVYWTISDASVATVINGVVTVITGSTKTAMITATTLDGGEKATCELKVNYCQVRLKKEWVGPECTKLKIAYNDVLSYEFGINAGVTDYYEIEPGEYNLFYCDSDGYCFYVENDYTYFVFEVGRKYTYLCDVRGYFYLLDDGPM